MTSREYIKTQADMLPEPVIERLVEFISFQKFNLGYEDDTDYLLSVPGMEDKINKSLAEPLSESVPISEVWSTSFRASNLS